MDQQSWTVYVLELEHGKYYVGRTQRSAEERLREHQAYRAGSRWTEMYRAIRILRKYPNCGPFDEDKYTKMYMSAFGIPNVRGGAYCQPVLRSEQIRLLTTELDSALGKCYNCGEVGHVQNDCLRPRRVQAQSWSSMPEAHAAEIPAEPQYPWNNGYSPVRVALEAHGTEPAAWPLGGLGYVLFLALFVYIFMAGE